MIAPNEGGSQIEGVGYWNWSGRSPAPSASDADAGAEAGESTQELAGMRRWGPRDSVGPVVAGPV